MRVLVMAGLVSAALVAPATACPSGARCLAMTTAQTSRIETAAAPPAVRRSISLTARLALDPELPSAPLHASLTSFRPIVEDSDAMPELWVIVATEVKHRLPRYDQDREFSMVLSPVVVTTPTESTPGLGLAGAF